MTMRNSTPVFPHSKLRSAEKVRTLESQDLGLATPISTTPLVSEIPDDDSLLLEVQTLLADGYAGVIFTGPPGTSKSWFAYQIAAKLAELDADRVRFIQFHASYQYEDFVEGFVPSPNGFRLKDKHLLEMCEVARRYNPFQLCVLVIDELSRSDPGRVFGEALTYIEMTKRNQPFSLASGKVVSIPQNLIILATMNPMDRGVDEVDAALERRFAKIAMDPSATILREFLTRNGMDTFLLERVVRFFEKLQRNSNPYSKIGHTYFYNVKDEQGLVRLWQNQLRFQLEKAFRLDAASFREIEADWQYVLAPPVRKQSRLAVNEGSEVTNSSTEGQSTVTNEANEQSAEVADPNA